MTPPDEELRKAVALFRYGLIADVLRVPLGSREIRRALHEKAQRTYTIPGTRRTRVAVETMRDWLSLYRTGGFEALYPKTRADRGQPRRLPGRAARPLRRRRRGVLNPLPHPRAPTTTAPVRRRRARCRTLPHHDRRDHRDHRGAGVRVRSLRATSALRQWGDNVRNRAPLDQK